MHVCVGVCRCMYPWGPELNVGCLTYSCTTSVFEAGSLTDLKLISLSRLADWLASELQGSTHLCPLLTQFCGGICMLGARIQTQLSCLPSRHLTDSASLQGFRCFKEAQEMPHSTDRQLKRQLITRIRDSASSKKGPIRNRGAEELNK